MARVIDLNADVGEGMDSDIELLAFVTSANVACGFHAGDASTMRAVCAEAVERGVAIGAHVGDRDREGFGRRALDVSAATVEAEERARSRRKVQCTRRIRVQLAVLDESVRLEGEGLGLFVVARRGEERALAESERPALCAAVAIGRLCGPGESLVGSLFFP